MAGGESWELGGGGCSVPSSGKPKKSFFEKKFTNAVIFRQLADTKYIVPLIKQFSFTAKKDENNNMESKNVFQVWKQQMLNRPFDVPSDISGKVEDDLITIRKSLHRNGLLTLLTVVLSIGMCGYFIFMCCQNGITFGPVFTIVLLLASALAAIRGWWRSHEWNKAEIYYSTKDYLRLSADMIRKYVRNLTFGFYAFYAFLVMANVIMFTGHSSYDPKIYLCISILCGISWGRKYNLMKTKTALYNGVAEKLEGVAGDFAAE
jgi:hypothetical protein